MMKTPWPLPPEDSDDIYEVKSGIGIRSFIELPDEEGLDNLWAPAMPVEPISKPPAKLREVESKPDAPQTLPLTPKLKKALQHQVMPLAPQEETMRLGQLVEMLMPEVDGKLVFADLEPYLQDLDRPNTFKQISKTEAVDWLRMLLPEGRRRVIRSKEFKEVYEVLRAECSIGTFENAFNNHPGLLNTRSGVVCLDRGVPFLIPDDPDVRFTYAIDADFNPELRYAYAPAWEQFLDTSLEGDLDRRQQLAEYIGYCLADSVDGKVIMFLTGASNSGKSVILRFLNRLLPADEVTNFSLHEIGNPFNGQQLCRAKINISYETDAAPLVIDAMLKALSGGGDRIAASRKFRDAKTMTPRAKLICAANTLPELKTGDTSDAFFNRIEALPFSVEIPKEAQDRSLLERLWKERSIIFTEAAYAVAELFQRGFRFTRCPAAEELLYNYRHSANSFLAFETAHLEYGPRLCVGCSALFKAYQNFCEAASMTELKKQEFRKLLLSRPGVSTGIPWLADGTQLRSYIGVAFTK